MFGFRPTGLRRSTSLGRFRPRLSPLEVRETPAASLLIAEVFANPSGTDSPFEYVKLIATEGINFASTPYSVVFNNNGTASTSGWVAGGTRTYGFTINSGSVAAGGLIAVGGSSLQAPVTKARTLNTGTTAGDGFGSASSGGVLGNGGSSADGVAIFKGTASSLTSASVPQDAIFFGTAVGSAALSSGGYQLPVNDRYAGGTMKSTSYIAPSPGTGQLLRASGTYSTATGSFASPRAWSLTTGHTATSGITISSTGGGGGTGNDAYEPNDTLATAYNLGTLSASKAISSLALPANDQDHFKFTTTAAGTSAHSVRIAFTHSQGDIDLRLYNSAGTQVGASEGTGNSESISLNGLAAGTYTAKVWGYNGAANAGGYSLTIDPPAGTVTPPAADAWTVLVYITASDLETFAFQDINEMETAVASLPSSVNVVALWDQSALETKYATGNGTQAAWGTTGRAQIIADTNMSKVATTFELLPEQNTGSPTNLVNFITWGASIAPAEKYAVVMWNHGAGMYGSNYDDRDGGTTDHLTAAELASAFANPALPAIQLISFDACLMGQLEVGDALRADTDVFVGAEELVPGTGHDYRTLFNVLKTNPHSVTAEQLGSGFVTSYYNQYQGTTTTEDTHSAIRTSGYAGVRTALRTFTDAVDVATTADVTRLRTAISAAVTYDDADLKDLGSYMAAVQANTAIASNIRAAAGGVLTAISNAVVARTADTRNSRGMSVYLPSGSPMASYSGMFSSFNAATDWSGFLTRVSSAAMATGGSPRPDGRAQRADAGTPAELAWLASETESEEFVTFARVELRPLPRLA